MPDIKKYLDLAGLQTYHTKLVDSYLSVVNKSQDATPVYTVKADKLKGITATATYTGEGANRELATGIELGANTELSASPAANDDSNKIATTGWVQDTIQGITEPMIFEGTVSVEVTTSQESPYVTYTVTADDETLTSIKKGYTFKINSVTSDGQPFAPTDYPESYTGDKYAVGDTLIATSIQTTVTDHEITADLAYIPSGDEPSGTVTSVTAGTGLQVGTSGTGTSITSSGTLNLLPATDSAIGGVSIADDSTISNSSSGVIDVKVDNATIKKLSTTGNEGKLYVADATTDTKGAVQIGTNIDVDGNGVISVKTSNASDLGVVKADGTTITVGMTTGENPTSTGVLSAVTATAVPEYTTGETTTGTKGLVAGSNETGVLVSNVGVLSIATISNDDVNGLTW